MQVMASDADDPTYGSSARVVYSVLEGEQHFTVDSKTGEQHPTGLGPSVWGVRRPDRGHASRIGPVHGCVPAGLRLRAVAVGAGVPAPWASLGAGEEAPSPAGSLQCPQQAALWSETCSCQPRVPRAPLCPEHGCTRRHIKSQCERFKYYRRGLTKGCIVITGALIKGNTLN